MYPNIRAEIARKNLTLADIVKELRKRGFRMTVPTLSQKLNKKFEFTLKEAKALKEILGTDIPIDELFEEAQ
jgi:hypothetical protein